MKECPSCRRCFADEINHCPDDGNATAHSITGEPILDSRYQLERRLGHGGMGVVFHARHIFLKTQHAIKVILPDLVGNDPMLVTRFRQEALAAAAIRHQNIIAVTDFGVVRGVMPFLVMEYVRGCSLQDLLAAETRLSPERALEIISAVGAGVGAAHKQNIVHRDLKPLNIMMHEGVPVAEGLKVLDFGLAKIKSGELLGSFVQAKTSGLMGSPFYMAPEQWSDEEPDVRADIYSLGVILYQMLAGEVPFRGSSIPSIMKKHLTTDAPPFSSYNLSVPETIEQAVRHALAKDADHRPQTVEQFVSEFREAVLHPGPAPMLMQTMASIDPREVIAANTITGASLPAVGSYDTSVFIQSSPPDSRVFVNNVAVGVTNGSGRLVLSEMLRGKNKVVVLHEGYEDWSSLVDFPGGEFHLEVKLAAKGSGSLPPGFVSGTIGASSLSDAGFRTGAGPVVPGVEDQASLRAREEQERGNKIQEEESRQLREVEERRIAEDDARKRADAQAAIIKQIEEETRLRQEREARDRGEAEALAAEKNRADMARIQQMLDADKQRSASGNLSQQPQTPSVNDLTSPYLDSAQSVKTGYETQVLTPSTGTGTASGQLAEIPQDSVPIIHRTDVPPAIPDTVGRRSALPAYIVVGVLFVLLVLGVGTWYVVKLSRNQPPVVKVPSNNPPNNGKVPPQDGPVEIKPDLVAIPGGSFQMGTDKEQPLYGPPHTVTVAPFLLDRTEVTNAEYSSFLKVTNYEVPPGWVNGQPPPGQELWPVANVSIQDINTFAEWRSARDHVTYRLPSEEEWEFAARSGSSANLYPWGPAWDPKLANIGSRVIQPVGSFPDGKDKWGVVDLIGNVWEWTSSRITPYPGNKNPIPSKQVDWVVIRGGSYSSEVSATKALTSASRQWVEASRRDGLLGFRLARSVNQ